MPSLTVNGVELHHERRGAGEPLLLVQGMSGHSLHWGEDFVSRLEDELELILYDHRGIGRSARVTESFTIVDLAEDAMGLLDALGIERTHLLGISMGGMVAQEIALRAPDRVRTLTLGASYCGGPDAQLTDEGVIEMLGDAMLSGDRDRAIRTGWEVNVSSDFAAEDSNYDVYVEISESFPAPVAAIMSQFQAIAEHDTSSRLGQLRVPTLVIHGTADQMLDSANGELIARRIPGARLELLEGIGHLFFWEQPERCAELVREHALATRS